MPLKIASPSPRVEELVSVSSTEVVVFDERVPSLIAVAVAVAFPVSSLALKLVEAV
jgi:hypothetical protein